MASVVNVLRLEGVISSKELSLATMAPLICKAFTNADAVALIINSPGGSPAQSSLLFNYIRMQAYTSKIPVISFVEDYAASGGYWLALAGDSIVVNETSLVGSIGVVGASFGFVKLIDMLGVERRVYTAGKRKHLNDPFMDQTDDGMELISRIQAQLHQAFIDVVKQRRGTRLKELETELFDGNVWVGEHAIDLGLADATYFDMEGFMKELLDSAKIPTRRLTFKYIERKKPWFYQFTKFFGASMVDAASQGLQHQLLVSHLGR